MFYYLSFIRPPPVQAGPYGTILITPQIANDLRTEPFMGEQDLYYAWSLLGPKPTTTRANKFTTWRPGTAYKEIALPVPPGVREGQYWRLIITAQQQQQPQQRALQLGGRGVAFPDSIDLRGTRDLGAVPFPVVSMPIAFVGRGSKGAAKQELIKRTYLVPYRGDAGSPDSDAPAQGAAVLAGLSFTENTSFDLDKKIWDSGIGLSSWLVDLHENSAATPRMQKFRDALFSEEPRTILELGSGIGMLSIVLSVVRSRPLAPEEEGKDRIVATDVESAMPLLEENITANSQYFQSTKPEAKVLNWDDELSDEILNLGGLDAIVMADVTYNTASFAALCKTLERVCKMGDKSPILFLGYKERDAAERSFWKDVSKYGIGFEKVGERGGAGGPPVEIWAGRMRGQLQ